MSLYGTIFQSGEKESRDAFESNFAGDGTEASGGHIVLVAADALGTVQGGIIFSRLSVLNCGYVSYILVAPPARGQGIGTRLYQTAVALLEDCARRTGMSGSVGMFTEVERGTILGSEAHQRLRFWERLAVRPLDFEWRYPELIPGEAPIQMDLAYGPADAPGWTASGLKAATRAIFAATYAYLGTAPAVLQQVLAGLDARAGDAVVPYRAPLRFDSRVSQ